MNSIVLQASLQDLDIVNDSIAVLDMRDSFHPVRVMSIELFTHVYVRDEDLESTMKVFNIGRSNGWLSCCFVDQLGCVLHLLPRPASYIDLPWEQGKADFFKRTPCESTVAKCKGDSVYKEKLLKAIQSEVTDDEKPISMFDELTHA